MATAGGERVMGEIKLAPKGKQPVGGFKHPRHLLGYGPMRCAWSARHGWYETNEYCISPSSKLWRADFVRG